MVLNYYQKVNVLLAVDVSFIFWLITCNLCQSCEVLWLQFTWICFVNCMKSNCMCSLVKNYYLLKVLKSLINQLIWLNWLIGAKLIQSLIQFITHGNFINFNWSTDFKHSHNTCLLSVCTIIQNTCYNTNGQC